MQSKHLYTLAITTLLCCLLLSVFWEFWLEEVISELLFGHPSEEGFFERIEYVITVMVFVSISLLITLVFARQIIERESDRLSREREMLVEQAEKKRRQEVKENRKRLFERVSQEMRTPLNAIMGFSQLLEMSLDANTQRLGVERSQEIYKAGSQLMALVNGMLSLNTLEYSGVALRHQLVQVGELLGECMEMIAPAARHGDISLDSQVRPALALTTDRELLRQIFINLLSNAILYNKRGGQVRIQAHLDSFGWVRVEVSDTGIGLDEQQQQQLFSPLEKLSNDGNKLGSGLGLSISRCLAERMGGELKLASSYPGEGSTFMLRLPTEPPGQPH